MITIIDRENTSLFGIYDSSVEIWLKDNNGVIFASNCKELLEAQINSLDVPQAYIKGVLTSDYLHVKLIYESKSDKMVREHRESKYAD